LLNLGLAVNEIDGGALKVGTEEVLAGGGLVRISGGGEEEW
jgi:hypothetical protein